MPYQKYGCLLFNVEARTIERYVSDNADELMKNGYEILPGQHLKSFIQCIQEQDVPDIIFNAIR